MCPMTRLKVIVRRKTGEVARGFLQAPPDLAPGQYLSTLPDTISLQVEGSSETATIEVASLKAVFFVKRFTGDPQYREVKFFSEAPLSEDLWVRLRFFDKEILEGTV